MADTLAPQALSTLETAVLRSVVYADLFDFPLTPAEARRWLPASATQAEVDAALSQGALPSRLLVSLPPYVLLRGRDELVATRERRRHSSLLLNRRARFYGALIARLPFVRMVAITGSLAVDNADEGADFDYLMVVAPGRVWLTRAMTMLIVRAAALRGVTVCPNYLLAESALALPERDFYTARELLQMRPVAGLDVYRKMLAVNGWWRDYLPNAEPDAIPAPGPSRSSLARRVAEALLRARPLDYVERWLLVRKGAELRHQAGGAEAVFDSERCKGHFEGWREQTARAVEERLARLLAAAP
jgi:hypothetical protein